jgi:hypothetical protein
MFSIIERSFKFLDNGFGFKIPKICLIKKTCPRKAGGRGQGSRGAGGRGQGAGSREQGAGDREQGTVQKFLWQHQRSFCIVPSLYDF